MLILSTDPREASWPSEASVYKGSFLMSNQFEGFLKNLFVTSTFFPSHFPCYTARVWELQQRLTNTFGFCSLRRDPDICTRAPCQLCPHSYSLKSERMVAVRTRQCLVVWTVSDSSRIKKRSSQGARQPRLKPHTVYVPQVDKIILEIETLNTLIKLNEPR